MAAIILDLAGDEEKAVLSGHRHREAFPIILRDVTLMDFLLELAGALAGRLHGTDQVKGDGALLGDAFFMPGGGIVDPAENDRDQIIGA